MLFVVTGNVRSIMLRNCNFNYQSPEHLFDPSEPGGTYVCNLADPYERVVGNELVRFAHTWFNILKCGISYTRNLCLIA